MFVYQNTDNFTLHITDEWSCFYTCAILNEQFFFFCYELLHTVDTFILPPIFCAAMLGFSSLRHQEA